MQQNLVTLDHTLMFIVINIKHSFKDVWRITIYRRYLLPWAKIIAIPQKSPLTRKAEFKIQNWGEKIKRNLQRCCGWCNRRRHDRGSEEAPGNDRRTGNMGHKHKQLRWRHHQGLRWRHLQSRSRPSLLLHPEGLHWDVDSSFTNNTNPDEIKEDGEMGLRELRDVSEKFVPFRSAIKVWEIGEMIPQVFNFVERYISLPYWLFQETFFLRGLSTTQRLNNYSKISNTRFFFF